MRIIFLVLLIITVVNYIFFRFDSTQVSHFVGFRTPSAYKSKENWEHAQKIGYELTLPYFVFFTVLNYLISIPNWLNLSLIVFIAIVTIFTIEYKLR
ncbi:SdpI family protein [Lentilactobacillus raoultii]|uniref:SdpI family protein n=1 Tax=Lentilactobacillus raoultii TaxID=1987503 RepID=A0ABW3PP56_9LACO